MVCMHSRLQYSSDPQLKAKSLTFMANQVGLLLRAAGVYRRCPFCVCVQCDTTQVASKLSSALGTECSTATGFRVGGGEGGRPIWLPSHHKRVHASCCYVVSVFGK
jgi:hypothetical protein